MSRPLALGVGAIALVLVIAAVVLFSGGGDDETSSNPGPSGGLEAPSGGATPGLGALPPGFAECLADQGIDIEPDADIGEILHGGAAPPQAVEACFDALHQGGGP